MSDFTKGLISIIIPAYESETYLRECLTSVVNQTYPQIEVIISYGKSKDKTYEIIQEFQTKYNFIQCIERENRGVSAARNLGIRAAKGEFIQFVDSDDFLLPDACERLVGAIEKYDASVVIAGFHILKTGEERQPLPGVYAGGKEFFRHLDDYYDYQKNCMNTPWNKLYRHKDLTAVFPEDLSLGEDLLFNLQVLAGEHTIAVIPDIVYDYNNVNDTSLAYRYRENGFEIETMIHQKMMEMANLFGVYNTEVLYKNYLYGWKVKVTALAHRSGKSCVQCSKIIRNWMKYPAMLDMIEQYHPTSKADKMLFYMIRKGLGGMAYWYYRTFW